MESDANTSTASPQLWNLTHHFQAREHYLPWSGASFPHSKKRALKGLTRYLYCSPRRTTFAVCLYGICVANSVILSDLIPLGLKSAINLFVRGVDLGPSIIRLRIAFQLQLPITAPSRSQIECTVYCVGGKRKRTDNRQQNFPTPAAHTPRTSSKNIWKGMFWVQAHLDFLYRWSTVLFYIAQVVFQLKIKKNLCLNALLFGKS